MAKHMGLDERKRIELLLGLRWKVAEIAHEMGRTESTISREVLARRVTSNRGYGCTNRICEHFDTCRRMRSWGAQQKLHKHLSRCFEGCDEFRERACLRVGSSPYVCNGCEKIHSCPLAKRLYVASAAQANYGGTLRGSRSGVRPGKARVDDMNRVLSPCILRGQSIRHVMASNPDVFRGVGERSVYRYVGERLFDVTRGDLPATYKRRPQKRQAETKTRAKQRVGRTYREFCEFRDANDGVEPVELDTVLGTMGGKVLFTLMFPSKLMLAFLRDAKTPRTCTRVFNQIWEAAGARLFRRMFPVVLTDNGTEFADPEGIEFARADPVHNPHKLVRRTRVFFCDAYRASQKPHVERNHEELRAHPHEGRLVRLAHAGAGQPRALARQQLHARRPRQRNPLRRVREGVRRRGEGVPRKARDRQDPGERGHALPVPPREQVQANRRQGSHEKTRRKIS